MCVNKFSYDTKVDALKAGQKRWMAGVRGLFVYRCPSCAFWHLTRAESVPEVSSKLFEVPEPEPEPEPKSTGTIRELLDFKRKQQ